jgi:hypothetical protein
MGYLYQDNALAMNRIRVQLPNCRQPGQCLGTSRHVLFLQLIPKYLNQLYLLYIEQLAPGVPCFWCVALSRSPGERFHQTGCFDQ